MTDIFENRSESPPIQRRRKLSRDNHAGKSSRTQSDRHRRSRHGRYHEHPLSKDLDQENEQRRSETVIAQTDTGLSPFFSDRKGDPQNLVYGGLHRGEVPRYRKVGDGRLIGLDRRFKLSYNGSRVSVEEYVPDPAKRFQAQSLLTFKEDIRSPPVRVFSLAGSDEGIALQQSYILVDSDNRKGRKTEKFGGNPGHCLDLVRGRALDYEERQDSDGSSSSQTSNSPKTTSEDNFEDRNPFESFRNDFNQKRLVELSRATIERPQNLDVWLALVKHHDRMTAMDGDGLRIVPLNTDKRSAAELKISIYEKAITHVRVDSHRETLILGLMEEGAKVWDMAKLSAKWQALLRTLSSLSLWIRYLDFQQSNSSTFTYKNCLSVYKECFQQARSRTPSFERDKICVYILLRLTVFMMQAGYSENAIAMWQALLEFNFFRPEQADASTEIDLFEEFWESERPRIGEQSAVGWRENTQSVVLPQNDVFHDPSCSSDFFQSWVECENQRMETSKLPARTLDGVAEDDPFRIVLFSDISDFLYRTTASAGHNLLLNAFLKFCDMPALHTPNNPDHCSWWTDSFLYDAILLNRVSDSSMAFTPSAVFATETAALFAAEQTWSSPWPNNSTSRRVGPERNWRSLALTQLVDALAEDDYLAEYTVASSASVDLKEARKYAKTLLKKRPSSLRLYNAYALVECRLGNFETADYVWSTALSMRSTSQELDQATLALLWRSWVWESVERKDVLRAERLLLALPDGRIDLQEAPTVSFSTAVASLKAQNHLQSQLSQHISLRRDESVLHYCDLLALFVYLSTSRSLCGGLAVFDRTLQALSTDRMSSTLVESLHQSRARLLLLHILLMPNGYCPAEIRRKLLESVSLFPTNTMLLHIHHSQSGRSLDRIRDALSATGHASVGVLEKSCPVSDAFSIYVEISRPSYAGSTHHSIRAAFERALAAESNISIWTWYVLWEAQLLLDDPYGARAGQIRDKKGRGTERKRDRAVEIFYRALRACPWAKQLYMLAFSSVVLRHAIGKDELRKLYEAMMATGLRIRVDLDDIAERTATT